jgi:hypothetical protein
VRTDVTDAKGVAIGVCAYDPTYADASARPRGVFDEDGLPNGSGHAFSQDAGDGVSRAASWKRHD